MPFSLTTFKSHPWKKPVFPVPRGPHELQRNQKARHHGRRMELKCNQLCSTMDCGWGLPEKFCWVSVFHLLYHTSCPPNISGWVSKPLLRASAFCTNINILYLPRQPAVKNSFSSKFCFDSLLLSRSYWKLDKLYTPLGFSSLSTFINIL